MVTPVVDDEPIEGGLVSGMVGVGGVLTVGSVGCTVDVNVIVEVDNCGEFVSVVGDNVDVDTTVVVEVDISVDVVSVVVTAVGGGDVA